MTNLVEAMDLTLDSESIGYVKKFLAEKVDTFGYESYFVNRRRGSALRFSGEKSYFKQLPDYEMLMKALDQNHQGVKSDFLEFQGVRIVPRNTDAHKGNTPLHQAVLLRNDKVVQNLLSDSPPSSVFESINDNNETPLHVAIKINNKKVLKELLSCYNSKANVIDDNGISHVHVCMTYGQLNTIKKLLDACKGQGEISDLLNAAVKTNSVYFPGYTALHFAVKYKRASSIINFLINNGGDISMKNKDGETPVHLAYYMQDTALVSTLLESNQKFIENSIDSRSGVSIFHIACSANKVGFLEQYLKTNKIPVNVSRLDFFRAPGYSPLHFAVEGMHETSETRDTKIIQLILEHCKDINVKNGLNQTAIHLAHYYHLNKAIELLLTVENSKLINSVDNNGISIFHISCSINNEKIVKKFIEEDQIDVNFQVPMNSNEWSGYTALHIAVVSNCMDVIKILLKCNADPTIANAKGETALHLAFSVSKNNEMVDLMLKAQLDKKVNPLDKNGISHFHIACCRNNAEIVEEFLKSRISPNLQIDENMPLAGYTPLHFAAQYYRPQIIKILLKYRAKINIKSSKGLVPLHLACSKPVAEIDMFIRKAVFNSVIKNKGERLNCKKDLVIPNDVKSGIDETCSQQFECIKLLVGKKCNVNIKDINEETALFYLFSNEHFVANTVCDTTWTLPLHREIVKYVFHKNMEVINYLISNNAKIDLKNKRQETIFHLISKIQPTYFSVSLEDFTINIMKNKKIDVNASEINGKTPLYLAASYNNIKFVEILSRNDANVNMPEKLDKMTPLHISLDKQHYDVAKVLISSDADVFIKTSSGHTPLHILAKDYKNGKNIDLLEDLLKLGSDIYDQDESKKLPFSNIYYDTICELLDMGIDLNVFFTVKKPSAVKDLINNRRIEKEILKLKVINYAVQKKITNFLAKDFFTKNKEYLNKCFRELMKIKDIKVLARLSLYDLLYKNVHQTVIFLRNKHAADFFESRNLKNEFSIYGPLLLRKYQNGLARKNLIETAANEFINVTGFSLPDLIYDEIFKYLKNKDLNSLKRTKDIALPKPKVEIIKKNTSSSGRTLRKRGNKKAKI